MTKEQLEQRIEKKETEIKKIEKRIAKWTSGMNEEAKQIAASMEVLYDDPIYKERRAAYREYDNTHKDDSTVYNPVDWNKGPSLDEAQRAYLDLAEAKNTLRKYNTELDKLTNFENEEKIPVIWNFLQKWRKDVYDYVLENAVLYTELRHNEEQAWNKYLEEHPNLVDKEDKWYSYKLRQAKYNWLESYYAAINSLTKSVTDYFGNVDTNQLNKILDEDVKNKYTNLVHQITQYTGVITDASGLSIGAKGDINGVVIGEKGKAKVQTFGAGGYTTGIVNVKHGQIFHYRTRVDPVK